MTDAAQATRDVAWDLETVCPRHPGRLSGFPLTQYRDRDPQRIVFFDAGQGDTVVFIHGLGGNLTHFSFVAPALAESCRVIGLDLPGFGDSERPADGYSYAAMARDVFSLLDRRGVGHVTVVGHSFGGAVATLMALEAPERVTGLVAVNPAGYQRFPWWMRLGSHVALRPEVLMPSLFLSVYFILKNVCQAEGPGVDAFVRSSTQLENGFRFLRDMAAAAHGLRGDLVERHFVDELHRITAPAHLVWGAADRLLGVDAGEAAAKRLGDARFTRLPGVGHMPIFEQPEAVIAAVRDVLSRARTRRAASGAAEAASGTEPATAGRIDRAHATG
jgi:pyruvate dehydrogenase E2 component (dihydrolipoamide acetyltransferase)